MPTGISDDNSCNMTDYLRLVAELAELPMPPEIPLDEAQLSYSSELLSYLDESRRVNNARMRTELGVQLRYVDLKQGILASLAEQAEHAARRYK